MTDLNASSALNPAVMNNTIAPLNAPFSVVSNSSAVVPTNVVAPALELGVSGARTFNSGEGSTATAIAPEATITGGEGTLTGLRVIIAKNFTNGDVLLIQNSTGTTSNGITSGTVNAAGTNLEWKYNSQTGILSLDNPDGSPNASNEAYQEALRQVTFSTSNPAASPTTARDIQISLGDLLINSENGHYYEFINSTGISWTEANTDASNRRYFGFQGYLATIASEREQRFVEERVQGNGWIGASDAQSDGQWRWVTGPEGLEEDGRGRLFWSGQADVSQAANATPAGGPFLNRYSNWLSGEPNNLTTTLNGQQIRESYAHIIGNETAYPGVGREAIGRWNDLYNDIATINQQNSNFAAFNSLGYIIEYGGFLNDPDVKISGIVTVNVNNGNQGDGIILRNYTDVSNTIWGVKDFQRVSEQQIEPLADTNWVMVTTANFDGDGKDDDILWRNSVTGENATWILENGTLQSNVQLPILDQNWRFGAVADFNGDGQDDIAWQNTSDGQNAIWFINNGNRTDASGFISVLPGRDWQIQGGGFFDGDNKADLFWRNTRTGETAIWMMDGLNLVNGAYLATVVDLDWNVSAVGDTNGDGKSDLAWRNSDTGDVAIWIIDGFTINQADIIATITDQNWVLEATGDYNGDGNQDLLWRNYNTGESSIWWMFGDSIIQTGLIRDSSNNPIILEGGPVGNRRWELIDSYALVA